VTDDNNQTSVTGQQDYTFWQSFKTIQQQQQQLKLQTQM
jgi:hypothetical protein